MNKEMKIRMKKITKVIRLFEEDVKLLLEDRNLKLDTKGRPIKQNNEKTVKMAFMTFRNRYNVPETINNPGSILTNKKECYYILKDSDDFKITENMKVIRKNEIYRINAIEENYGIFLRMELDIDDKR